jgi:error-prone DNA polymerase
VPEPAPGKSGPWPERKIRPPRPEVLARRRPKAGEPVYAELHCHTNFSFLDGASHPEDLVAEAARLGLSGLAVTDHDGLYGAVRFSGIARDLGLPTVFGVEFTLGTARPSSGVPDPEGEHLVVLAEGRTGYARLARAASEAQMRGGKAAPRLSLEELAEAATAPVHLHPDPSPGNDSWFVLTGCRKGPVPKALVDHGPSAAERELHRLVELFGRDRVLVEVWDHGDPLDRSRNDALATSTTPRPGNGRWPRPWPPSGRGARSTRSTGGSRPAPVPTSARPPSSTAASPAGRVRSSAPSRSPEPVPSTWPWPRRTCPTSPSRPATTR